MLQVLFLLFCAMSGIRNIGIRCCWLTLYKIRAWRTPPRGMLLAVLTLMLIILSQTVVMFSLVPDYTMFGNQHYQHTVNNKTVITRCSTKEFPDQKVKQTISDKSWDSQFLVPGLLCSLEDLSSPPVLPLQSLDIRSLLLLSYLGLDRLHPLWIFVLNLPYEVIKRNQPMKSI